MLVRYNRELDIVDESIYVQNAETAQEYELAEGQEWIDVDSDIYKMYRLTSTNAIANKISYFSQLMFDERVKVLPEHKLINASLGVYDATETARIKGIVEAFRTEYYRLEALCKQAKSIEELEGIQEVINLKLNEVYVPTLDEILSNFKNNYMNLLDNKFNDRLKQGYFDETLNITLCFEDVDRSQLSQLLIQIDNLEKIELCPPTITFSDFSGGFQTVSILEYRGLIARYGMKYVEVWGIKKYYEGLINSCSDEESMTTLKTQIDNLEL